MFAYEAFVASITGTASSSVILSSDLDGGAVDVATDNAARDDVVVVASLEGDGSTNQTVLASEVLEELLLSEFSNRASGIGSDDIKLTATVVGLLGNGLSPGTVGSLMRVKILRSERVELSTDVGAVISQIAELMDDEFVFGRLIHSPHSAFSLDGVLRGLHELNLSTSHVASSELMGEDVLGDLEGGVGEGLGNDDGGLSGNGCDLRCLGSNIGLLRVTVSLLTKAWLSESLRLSATEAAGETAAEEAASKATGSRASTKAAGAEAAELGR